MKAKLLFETLLVNALYSRSDADAAKAAGRPYDLTPQILVGAGYVLDDPQSWIHCCPGDTNSSPIAEPIDDECREAVRVWMEEKRPAGIAAIKAQLDQIDMIKDEGHRKRLKELGRAYGLLPGSESRAVKAPKSGDVVS